MTCKTRTNRAADSPLKDTLITQWVVGTKIDETSNAHCGGYPIGADDRSGGMQRQSNPHPSIERFSDRFGNGHNKSGNRDKNAHSDDNEPTLCDAERIRINYSDANVSTFVYTHAIHRAV
jgi:hypothetical protein